MNKVIIPTGYMGSGSSAITDLVREFDGYEISQGDFEYIFLHCPNGLFDLEDKLLIGNNALRSDEAIHSFRRAMEELYDSKFWWPGNYKKKLSKNFMNLTNAFLNNIIQYETKYYWYMQEKTTVSIFIKLLYRKVIRTLSGNRILLKKPLCYSPMQISFIDAESFYCESRKYIKDIFFELGIEEKNLVLDQLLLPHNLHRMSNYFESNVECIVVERDPRDVFISNKYIWPGQTEVVPYPTDVRAFCSFYENVRSIEKTVENEHVHRIHFEDLIYRYEETVSVICDWLGIRKETQNNRYKYFDPQRSIHNTQLFLAEKYKEEAAVIEDQLGDFLYRFPYEKEVFLDKVF